MHSAAVLDATVVDDGQDSEDDTSDAAYLALHELELGRMRRHFARLTALYGWGRRRQGSAAVAARDVAAASGGAAGGAATPAAKAKQARTARAAFAAQKKVSARKGTAQKKGKGESLSSIQQHQQKSFTAGFPPI